VEELADRDLGPGRAEAEVEGDVLPEVLGDEDVAAQGFLGAGHGEHHADAGETGEGEAPPVPAALEQDHRLPSSQAAMDSGENQTSRTMTSSRPLAAGWRAARGMG
jgi:hypothetical protein